jgi:hypothetical protein
LLIEILRKETDKMSGFTSDDLFVLRETAIIAAESALLEIVTELAVALTPENINVPEVLKNKEDGQFCGQDVSSVHGCNVLVDTLGADSKHHHSVLSCLMEILRSLKERNRSRGFQLECVCQESLLDRGVSTPAEYSLEQPFDTLEYLMNCQQQPVTD